MLYIFSLNDQLRAVLKNDGTACPYSDPIHVEKLNGENTFTFTVPANHTDSQFVVEGNQVAFKDLDLNWQLFEIKRVTDIHGDGLTRTAFCEHAYYELIDDFIRDVRPTDCSATFALTQALNGTRWNVGMTADLGLNSTNYYYESALSSVQKVASVWKGELQFRVVVTGGVISGSFVDLLTRRGADTGKQWEYGRHIENIEREVDFTTVVTALYGRGKGVQVETGGYGRRLDFASIVWTTPTNPADKPAGQEWVGDPVALAQWGRAGRHRFGTFEDGEETDPAKLLQKTWDELQKCKTPRTTYRMTVMDLERLSGYSHEKVRLGDTTRIIDREFSPALLISARVIEISRHLALPEETKITLGNFVPSLADNALTQQQVNQVVGDRRGVWDKATAFDSTTGKLATSWLNGIIDILQNEVQNTQAFVWVTAADGILIQNAATFAAATKAMKIGGGTFALANSKTGNAWNWRSFGTGDGFTADEINAGKIRTNLVRVEGNTNFYWDGDFLYITNPANLNEQIRLSKEGIRFTKDGGQSWGVALAFDGLRMEGKPTDPRIWYAPDGQRTYNQSGELVNHVGHYETLGAQIATFTRASTAYKQDGTSVASNIPRYEYHRLPYHRWQDLFDTDQIAAQYISGGDVAGTTAVSGGVLTYSGGSQATLVKKDLFLQDGEIIVNTDQAQGGGIIWRYQDNNNYYLLVLHDDTAIPSGNNLIVYTRVVGAWTILGAANVTWPRGTARQIRLTFHGSRIEAWFDNVKVISFIDTTFTGGSVGLRNNHVVGFRVLDWAVHQAEQGVMVEEGATNLLTANQASVETDLTGFVAISATITRDTTEKYSGSANLKVATSNTGAWEGFYTSFFTASAGTAYSAQARVKGVSGTVYFFLRAFSAADAWLGEAYTPITLNGTWQHVKVENYVTPANTAKLQLAIFTPTQQAITFYYDFGQVEQKAFCTMSQVDGTARAAEALTVPTAGILNALQGSIECVVKFDMLRPAATVHQAIFTTGASAPGPRLLIMRDVGQPGRIAVWDGDGTTEGSFSSSIIPEKDKEYLIMFTWSSAGRFLYINGQQVGTLARTGPIGFTSEAQIGTWLGNDQLNGILSNVRISNRARTLAEHQAAYNTGQPLAADEWTTYLMPCDGHLQPTVRGFGLWSKNGRMILQDPLAGQGLEVWDGGTRKVLIGRLDDNTIGQEIVGGRLYSTAIQSGVKGAASYTRIDAGFEPLKIVENNKDALTVWSFGGGMIQFYDVNANDMRGQIAPCNDVYGQGLRVSGRTNSGHGDVSIDGSIIYIGTHSTQRVEFVGGISSSILPFIDNLGYVGIQGRKWNTVRATFITPGDLCWQEIYCPICGLDFKENDVLVMLVKAIHEEHHTMTIPIHIECVGKEATFQSEVPETEERFRLTEDGKLESYRISRFEEYEAQVRQLKEDYELDEKTGRFKKKALVVDVAREGCSVIKVRDEVKYFNEAGDESSLWGILEKVEVFPEREAIQDEALEACTITKQRPVMKTITVQIGQKK